MAHKNKGMNQLSLAVLLLCGAAALLPAGAAADTDIGNGRLYICRGTLIVTAKGGEAVDPEQAKAGLRSAVRRQNKLIAKHPKGSAKQLAAIAAKREAKRRLKDIQRCQAGTLDNPFLGDWNLTLENGRPPAELGYNSLTLSFSADRFVSVLDGASLDCYWEGTYSSAADRSAVALTTAIGTGGPVCSQAVGQTQTAAAAFSDDGRALILDYRPAGALQEYERIR
jgi:hypothetical protein